VTATASRRAGFEPVGDHDLLVAQAVGDWMAAFREARRAKPPTGPQAQAQELGGSRDGIE